MEGLFGKYRVILAPMAGVSDAVMRALCLEQGADLAFTEMVSSKGLYYSSEKTQSLLALAEGEEHIGVQLFGHEPETMASQAAWVEDTLGDSLACVDVNMGCPARKIVSKGDGSALMESPETAESIVKAMRKAIGKPVTVKFRRGVHQGKELCVEFAKRMEQAGACAVTVHGRYADQFYRGNADWECISHIKDSVGVPVVANGDITSGSAALACMKATGCDAIMIARGAQGNPWVFAEIKAALDGIPSEKPSMQDRLEMARRHAHMLSRNEGRNIVRMRKHAMWYVAGFPGAREARMLINECTTVDDFDCLFDRMEERIAKGA